MNDQNSPLTERLAAVGSSGLLGAVVECSLAGHQGRWMVFEDMGGPCVRIQRPQDFRARWVDRKFISVIQQAPNTKRSHGAENH